MTVQVTLLTYIAIAVLGASGAKFSAQAAYGNAGVISPQGHQAIKAKVLNPDPAQFTINVKSFANMGVNEDAPTFAVYTSASMSKQCCDFSKLGLKYDKPEKYQRRFNLASNMDVADAINTHKCVVIKNIPSK